MPDRPPDAPSNLAENQTDHFRLLDNPESAKAKRLTIWLSKKAHLAHLSHLAHFSAHQIV